MMQIIYISISVALFYMTKTTAQTCGSPVSGPIMQPVTEKISYVDGLNWDSDTLLYVDRYNPHLCCLKTTGFNNCTKLKELNEISSVYAIKNVKDKLIMFADRKVILVNFNMAGDNIRSYTMKTITTITKNSNSNLLQSVTDNKERTIIGVTSKIAGIVTSTVYMVDADYVTKELIPALHSSKMAGIVFSSDFKYLFIGDSKNNLIYKYEYNSRTGVVGKREVVFKKTEHTKLHGYISTLGITKDNKLWISMGGTGMVKLYDCKTKKFLQHIKVPAAFPSSICYGGDKLDVLFIGTAEDEYTTLKPGTGVIYAVSGTGTVGYQQNKLAMPKSETTKILSKSDLSKSDFQNAAISDGIYSFKQ